MSARLYAQSMHSHDGGAGLHGTGRGKLGGGGAHRISKRSQVLVPSPQGDLRVVMPRILVGMRTGPFTLRCFSLAPRIRSADTAPHRAAGSTHWLHRDLLVPQGAGAGA